MAILDVKAEKYQEAYASCRYCKQVTGPLIMAGPTVEEHAPTCTRGLNRSIAYFGHTNLERVVISEPATFFSEKG